MTLTIAVKVENNFGRRNKIFIKIKDLQYTKLCREMNK